MCLILYWYVRWVCLLNVSFHFRHLLGVVMEAQDEHEAASECLMTAIDLEATHPIVPLTVIPRLLWAYQKFAVIQQPKTTRILKKWFLVVILLSTVNRITKSDERDTGVRFVYYEYESRQNWTTRSPVTNESTLWQNLRNKLAISDMFSWKKLQGTRQMRGSSACTWPVLSSYTDMTLITPCNYKHDE